MTEPMPTPSSLLHAVEDRVRDFASGLVPVRIGIGAAGVVAASVLLPPFPAELVLAVRALLLF